MKTPHKQAEDHRCNWQSEAPCLVGGMVWAPAQEDKKLHHLESYRPWDSRLDCSPPAVPRPVGSEDVANALPAMRV